MGELCERLALGRREEHAPARNFERVARADRAQGLASQVPELNRDPAAARVLLEVQLTSAERQLLVDPVGRGDRVQ
jgi:hypothetical protein